ncbi:MAG: prepilin-type N-terminal cleavage/methylation domain-containing protein [Elusimicrobiaceae bacterium]|nr:prepilin-type N-terminal cleavage/methylation domain-containing protein [Elusimicrobiaceae bacterium]MBP5616481.1 prepilin-type N-terminal cleavage/methylation domain-containing protein [Elusimicrobiaceae bacterium]
MKQQGLNHKGFTLIELLVVVLIIAILATVALPQYQVAVARSRLGGIQSSLASFKQAEELYYLYTGTYTNNTEDLDIDLPQCPKDDVWHNVPVCGGWLLDPIDGTPTLASSTVRAAYCPEVAKVKGRWTDCTAVADYYITYWLTHSLYPDKIECAPRTALGEKICRSFNH